MTKLVIVEGFDPTSVATPSNSQLLQMVHEAQPASDVGFVIFADDPPDITQYPVLERFLWCKTASGTPNGEVYFNDGASWSLITALSLSGGDISPGTITLDKLSPDGNPYQIIRLNATPDAFEFIDILDAIAAGTLPLAKLATAAGSNYFVKSNGSNVWAEVTAAVAYLAMQASGGTLTALASKGDFVTILKSDGSTSWKMTVESFLSDAINQLDAETVTVDADTVAVRQASSGLAKEVTLANLLPDKVAAGTTVSPGSITVDAKGRITAITTSTTSSCWLYDTQARGTAGQSISATTETKIRLTNASSASWLSLSVPNSNFTINGGTYEVDAYVPVAHDNSLTTGVVLLYDETAGAILATCTVNCTTTDDDRLTAIVKCIFTLASPATLSFRIYTDQACTIGAPATLAGTPPPTYPETYTQAIIRKLA